jgi:carbamoyltransferase
MKCLDSRGRFRAGAAKRCLRCFDCVEACPRDALRPRRSAASATHSRVILNRPGWLARLRGMPGPVLPAPFPPSFLLPKPGAKRKPRWVLGLAVATMQEHAAALLEDGKVVAAVEEERLSRVRHHGWKPKGRPGVTIASDPTICLEEVLCRRAVGALLAPRGLTLDDMDLLAVNGLPGRYRKSYSVLDASSPLPALRSGRVAYLPHHLCHAASSWRVSGQKESWILSVDGRGDRETAAVFKAKEGRIQPVSDILSLTDRSIGGVYETITQHLGFGAHGQGSVMALASFGKPAYDLSPYLSLRTRQDYSIHESGICARFAALARMKDSPLKQGHKDLAASLQEALEKTILALLTDCGLPRRAPGLCLAGGVTLNCRLNALLRAAFQPRAMFAQPGANDAGTALGAALESAALVGLPGPRPMEHAYLGPGFTEAQAEAALQHAGLSFERPRSITKEAAACLARGEVVCWCQGRLEFGPRALGNRSILADPRRVEMPARVNRIKSREPWRPFGPSILAGFEKNWFEDAAESRFMLFTARFKPGRAAQVPAVAHVDGTTRPQSVHKQTNPLYHGLISAFHDRTGVPMVLNTSFNRREEPIVCSPQEAADCFLAMPEADVLFLGPFMARRQAQRPVGTDRALARRQGGRRLMLRLTTRCDCDCEHCTIRDLAQFKDRSFADALRALAQGRKAGCSELVLMRGEPLLWEGLQLLLRRARETGYSFIQLQTSGRALARPDSRGLLRLADAFEITLLSSDAGRHDALAGASGAFREALMGARVAVGAGRQVLLHVPVLRRNYQELPRIAVLAANLGASRVTFSFPRPVETPEGVQAEPLERLAVVAPYVREALRDSAKSGLCAATEGIPFCHLDAEQRVGPDSGRDWTRFRVDDLDRLEPFLDPGRGASRPEAPACRRCRERRACPRTWALYLALFGSDELRALR